jgi:hypothetical protein
MLLFIELAWRAKIMFTLNNFIDGALLVNGDSLKPGPDARILYHQNHQSNNIVEVPTK